MYVYCICFKITSRIFMNEDIFSVWFRRSYTNVKHFAKYNDIGDGISMGMGKFPSKFSFWCFYTDFIRQYYYTLLRYIESSKR